MKACTTLSRKHAERRQRAKGEGNEQDEWQQAYNDKFLASINDDLNMPGALAAVHELINEANRRGEQAAILPTLFDWDSVLGLRLEQTAEAVWRRLCLRAAGPVRCEAK